MIDFDFGWSRIFFWWHHVIMKGSSNLLNTLYKQTHWNIIASYVMITHEKTCYMRVYWFDIGNQIKKLCPMIHFTNESQSRIFMSTLDFADISFVFIKLKCWKLAATPTYRSMIQMYIWNWNIEIWRGQTVKRIFDGPVLGQTI